VKEAVDIFINQRCIPVDSYTYASLLHGCVNTKALSEGWLVHTHMNRMKFKPDLFLATKLVSMYSKCGSLEDAFQVDEMPERNLVGWTAKVMPSTDKARKPWVVLIK